MGNTSANNVIEEQTRLTKGCYDHKIDHFKYEVTFEILSQRPFKWRLAVNNQNNDIYSLEINTHVSRKISPNQNSVGLYDQLLDSVMNPHPKIPKFRLFFIPGNSSENGDIHLPKRLSTEQVEYFRLDSVHQKKQIELSAVIEIHQMGAFQSSLLRYFILPSQKNIGESEIEKLEKKNRSLKKSINVEEHRMRARKASEKIRRTLSYIPPSSLFSQSSQQNSMLDNHHHHSPSRSLSYEYSLNNSVDPSFNPETDLSTTAINQNPERMLTMIENIMKEREKFALEKLEWERKKYIGRKIVVDFFRGTNILTRTQQKRLNRIYGKKEQEWQLQYSAEKHGWKSYSFHQKCDGVKGTMVVVKSRNGSIFGGFTQAEWSSVNSEVRYHPDTWLFSLETTRSDPPKKILQNHGEKASIYCDLRCGPTFGAVKITSNEESIKYERKVGDYKHDLFICSDCHENNESYSDLGICFTLQNFEYGKEDTKNYLNQDHNFMPLIWNGIFQLEVFVPIVNI